ncbi:MAG TPA: acyl-CoA dehydrogenase family protein [Streptosporangiaceae bacterium]|nr:acyl-CoA dehydrogenase family protein [Streptosporangiaceae bacterium]
MMDFTPGESQQAVAALAAEILAAPDPWKELARAGLLDVSALGVLDVAVLLTEIGRRAPPEALKALATLTMGALPVLRWGDAALQQAVLPGVTSGELLLTAAIREPSDPQPTPPATAIANGKITGTKLGVPYAEQASLLLVPASMIADSFGQIAPKTIHDHGVALVRPGEERVELIRAPSSSGQPEYTLRMHEAPIYRVLGGAECVRDLYQLAVAGACALADGTVAGALALTRDHVATRRQFGRPLAEFQAVSQQIADTYIASRTLHLAALSACWRLAEGRDAAGDLDVAAWWCAEHAPRSVRTCHHLHGGLGMDATYPLHRFSSLAGDLVRYLGGAEYRLERLACSST